MHRAEKQHQRVREPSANLQHSVLLNRPPVRICLASPRNSQLRVCSALPPIPKRQPLHLAPSVLKTPHSRQQILLHYSEEERVHLARHSRNRQVHSEEQVHLDNPNSSNSPNNRRAFSAEAERLVTPPTSLQYLVLVSNLDTFFTSAQLIPNLAPATGAFGAPNTTTSAFGATQQQQPAQGTSLFGNAQPAANQSTFGGFGMFSPLSFLEFFHQFYFFRQYGC
jgi:hypothetical protein